VRVATAPSPNIFGFVHVPKTAGTSFVRGLEARCRRVHRDYAEEERTSPRVRRALYEHPTEPLPQARAALLRALVDEATSDPSEPVFLCGHFGYSHYPFAELGVPVIAFVRDPVDRVLSHYTYVRRARGEQRPLAQFLREEPQASDVQSKVLGGVELEDLAFLGVTELYRESVGLFNRQAGLDIPVLRRNRSDSVGWARLTRGRWPKRPAEVERLAPETRELILSRNAQDVDLYRVARELVDARLARAAIGD
jgi:hypothetical protein